jgi:hypothetical protein
LACHHGPASLGTTLLSVDDRPVSIAALKLRDGLMLTAFRQGSVREPAEMGGDLRAARARFLLSFGIERMRPATGADRVLDLRALVGVSLASIFMVFTHTSIVRVFFITAASFGALSLWGYTTQRDLTGMGSFLLMGLFGSSWQASSTCSWRARRCNSRSR